MVDACLSCRSLARADLVILTRSVGARLARSLAEGEVRCDACGRRLRKLASSPPPAAPSFATPSWSVMHDRRLGQGDLRRVLQAAGVSDAERRVFVHDCVLRLGAMSASPRVHALALRAGAARFLIADPSPEPLEILVAETLHALEGRCLETFVEVTGSPRGDHGLRVVLRRSISEHFFGENPVVPCAWAMEPQTVSFTARGVDLDGPDTLSCILGGKDTIASVEFSVARGGGARPGGVVDVICGDQFVGRLPIPAV